MKIFLKFLFNAMMYFYINIIFSSIELKLKAWQNS